MAEHLEGEVQMKPEKETWESTLGAARPILANLPRTEDLADLPDFEDYSLEYDFCAAMRDEMEGIDPSAGGKWLSRFCEMLPDVAVDDGDTDVDSLSSG